MRSDRWSVAQMNPQNWPSSAPKQHVVSDVCMLECNAPERARREVQNKGWLRPTESSLTQGRWSAKTKTRAPPRSPQPQRPTEGWFLGCRDSESGRPPLSKAENNSRSCPCRRPRCERQHTGARSLPENERRQRPAGQQRQHADRQSSFRAPACARVVHAGRDTAFSHTSKARHASALQLCSA